MKVGCLFFAFSPYLKKAEFSEEHNELKFSVLPQVSESDYFDTIRNQILPSTWNLLFQREAK